MDATNFVVLVRKYWWLALLCGSSLAHAAATAPALGTAASFTVLGANAGPTIGTVSCTGPGNVNGDVGTTFVGGITNDTCVIAGTVVSPVAGSVVTDFNNAYGALDAQNPACDGPIPIATTLLAPGVYCSAAGTTIGAGVTLTLSGTASDIWVFKIGTGGGGALTGTNMHVVMGGTASPCNVYWRTHDGASLTTSDFLGTLLSGNAITTTGGTYVGRAMATTDVTLTGPAMTGCSGPALPPWLLGDFDGDGKADVLWRNVSTGQNVGWLMNGLAPSSSAFLPMIADMNWEIVGVGDLNGNGKADVLWRNKVNGQNIGWLMNGLTVSSSAFLPTIADTNWEIKGVGDFDGDGKADVIWRNKVNGQNIGWLMNGLTVTSAVFLPTIADTNWEIKGVGDFNGDGKADVIWRNKSTGQNIGWLMNGLTISNSAFLPTIADLNWEIKGVGDFDGDGKADVMLRNKVSGENIGWLMNGLTILNSAFLPTIADTNWEVIKGVGDFNGDGKADVLWRNKLTGQNIGWLMNGLTVMNSAFLPTIADTNWR